MHQRDRCRRAIFCISAFIVFVMHLGSMKRNGGIAGVNIDWVAA